jgi:tetratricopeptide (TPR) repeat protein
MSIEEARQVVASSGQTAVIPPPSTTDDIGRLLDQQARTDPGGALRDQADAAPPGGLGAGALADFYYRRGLAAGQIGRARQEIHYLTRALEHGREAFAPLYVTLHSLALAEQRGGDFARHVHQLQAAIDAVAPFRLERDWQRIKLYFDLAVGLAWLGHLVEAEAALDEGAQLFHKDFAKGISRGWISTHKALYAQARAALLDVTGHHAEAEALARSALALLSTGRSYVESTAADTQHAFLARTLINQGRLLEAETEARRALTGALAKRGRNSAHTAWMLRSLVWTLREQGRYAESERLARVVVDIYHQTRTAPASLRLAVARADLAMALELQGRHPEALDEYEALREFLVIYSDVL